jgi:NADP-dependent 3-hydroxy acid dehydrogenase YdfG
MGSPTVDYAASTALVTGSTSGIGKAIAFELVARGIGRLVVHGRNDEKLKKTIAELEQHQTAIKTRVQTEGGRCCQSAKAAGGVELASRHPRQQRRTRCEDRLC